METPLEEMDIGSSPFTAFESLGRLFDITTSIIGSRARQRKDELRVRLGGIVHAHVCIEGNDCAEGQLIVGMSESPDVFYFFDGKLGDFFEVEIGREGLDACATCVRRSLRCLHCLRLRCRWRWLL